MPRALLTSSLAATALVLATAGSASAAETLSLSGPSSAAVGQPVVIQASGNDNPADGTLYLELDSIPTSAATTCPDSYLSGSQLATSTGGSLVALDDRELEDGAGNFSMPVGYRPPSAGGWLLCGYTDDGATDTLAAASLVLTATPAGGAPPQPGPVSPSAKPANTARPRVSRSHKKLVCSPGSWSGSPTSYSYRWLVNGKPRSGATGRKLGITRKLRGHRVQCGVRATNAAGGATALSSPFRVH
jgi:hypothetical protein